MCGCLTSLATSVCPLGGTSSTLALVVLVLLGLIDLSVSMRMISVDVPRYEAVGDSVMLTCNYDLEGEKLYSVKWYKDGNEFYRFVPKDSPPEQVFQVEFVRVDRRQSGRQHVVLRDLKLGSAGLYTCEASSEAPRFKTINGQGTLKIVKTPDSKPIISGDRHNGRGYRVNEWMNVNCTSPNSFPPADLKWYINNEMVDSSYLLPSPPSKSATGLYTASLGLNFRLKRGHFVQGHVTVTCAATIASEYFQTSKLYVQGIGLGEKALESRGTNDAASLSLLGGASISSRYLLLLLCVVAASSLRPPLSSSS